MQKVRKVVVRNSKISLSKPYIRINMAETGRFRNNKRNVKGLKDLSKGWKINEFPRYLCIIMSNIIERIVKLSNFIQ